MTVPELLRGGWRRASIEHDDGVVDTTSTVLWLQLESKMVDVRLAADQPELAARGSLAACSLDDLQRLAASESSSGFTTCTAISEVDGVRTATAEWFTRGHGVAFQPVTAYPEPGLLEWNDDATVMIERAPSGAYVEEWHRIAATEAPLTHRVLDDGRELYRAGDVAVVVRDRPTPVPRAERLDTLIAEAGEDLDAIRALVDCEFSIGERQGNSLVITGSTLPWRTGEVLDVEL